MRGMSAIEETCQISNNGSSVLKEIYLLVRQIMSNVATLKYLSSQRFACQFFDDGVAALVRVEDDGGPDVTGSPHIYAVEHDRFVI